MYGLPKIHNANVSLRPIFSMIGSAQHELAKWLSEVLDPVLQKYSKHCIKDSFTLAELMQNLNIKKETSFICSFEISSFFTNAPLSDNTKICTDALYLWDLPWPISLLAFMKSVCLTATKSQVFIFDMWMTHKPFSKQRLSVIFSKMP